MAKAMRVVSCMFGCWEEFGEASDCFCGVFLEVEVGLVADVLMCCWSRLRVDPGDVCFLIEPPSERSGSAPKELFLLAMAF